MSLCLPQTLLLLYTSDFGSLGTIFLAIFPAKSNNFGFSISQAVIFIALFLDGSIILRFPKSCLLAYNCESRLIFTGHTFVHEPHKVQANGNELCFSGSLTAPK